MPNAWQGRDPWIRAYRMRTEGRTLSHQWLSGWQSAEKGRAVSFVALLVTWFPSIQARTPRRASYHIDHLRCIDGSRACRHVPGAASYDERERVSAKPATSQRRSCCISRHLIASVLIHT